MNIEKSDREALAAAFADTQYCAERILSHGHQNGVPADWFRALNALAAQREAFEAKLAEKDKEIARYRDAVQWSFQARVKPWMLECFGPVIPFDKTERNHRFLEESLELVQSTGCAHSEAHQLVDYVFGRDIGEPFQEAGGVMVTLAALCIANDLEMAACGEIELARIWTKVEQIRAKQAAKPKLSSLPGAAT